MKVRYLGHSCVEILGTNHLVIDPDFTRSPLPNVNYILVSHAHKDHIQRVVDVPSAQVIASPDVCAIAVQLGIPYNRLIPVTPGDQIDNIHILPGYSRIDDPVYTFFHFLFRRRLPDPGGTPLSFLVQDDLSLLHIGDAHEAPLDVSPDILCLPWRKTPFAPERYKRTVLKLIDQFQPRFVLPIHYDMPPTDADPAEIRTRARVTVLDGKNWYTLRANNNNNSR